MKIPERFHNYLQSGLERLIKNDDKFDTPNYLIPGEDLSQTWEVELERQLQAWRVTPYWVDQPAKLEVSVPKGSLCNLNAKLKIGLPPDAVFNIITDPDNRRVFKNIKCLLYDWIKRGDQYGTKAAATCSKLEKTFSYTFEDDGFQGEVISRRVLVDEGLHQVVEVEQAAIWRFLWWSGTISVHAVVVQNRRDHEVKFRQAKSGFMKRFEGSWKIEPLFVDEQLCSPHTPKSLSEYKACSGGKGRVGSIVRLEQLIQPAIVPPPPISWYLSGITIGTTEMMLHDLLAEARRLRGAVDNEESERRTLSYLDSSMHDSYDIKERWRNRRVKQRKSRYRA